MPPSAATTVTPQNAKHDSTPRTHFGLLKSIKASWFPLQGSEAFTCCDRVDHYFANIRPHTTSHSTPFSRTMAIQQPLPAGYEHPEHPSHEQAQLHPHSASNVSPGQGEALKIHNQGIAPPLNCIPEPTNHPSQHAKQPPSRPQSTAQN